MQGKIIKGIAGFYYVNVVEFGVYECKAKGIFRKEKQKPLVGDNVEIEVLDEETMTGNITALLPRKNELIRPAVANIDPVSYTHLDVYKRQVDGIPAGRRAFGNLDDRTIGRAS